MDTDLKRAVEEYKPFIRHHRALLALHEQLEKLGDLDACRLDLESKVAAARSELEGAQVALEAARAEATRLKVDAEQVKASAVDAANEERRNAKAHYESQCAKAKRDAEKIVADAKAAAERVARDAREALRKVGDEAARHGEVHRATMKKEQGSLDELQAQISAKAAALAELEERLAKARQAAAAMLEGAKQ